MFKNTVLIQVEMEHVYCDGFRKEHMSKFKNVLINDIHNKFIEKRIGQYKDLIENLPKGNAGLGYYFSLLKEIHELRFKHE